MHRRTRLVAAGVGIALIAGGGGAFAARQLDSPRAENKAVIDDAAKKLGVTPSALSDALEQALKDRIDAAVAAGRLTRTEGDALKQRIDSGDFPFFFGGADHRLLGRFGLLDEAARYLGATDAQLRSELEAGKSLAEVAKAHGKSAAGLVDALMRAQTKRLDAAVAAGKVTKADEQSMLADLKQRITAFVNGTSMRPPPLGFRFRDDFEDFR